MSGIPDSVSDDDLEETVTDIPDIDVQVTVNYVEACNRFGKSKSKKTITLFVNRKHCTTVCRKILENKKKLASNDFFKYKFPGNTKIFANENLTYKYALVGNSGDSHLQASF